MATETAQINEEAPIKLYATYTDCWKKTKGDDERSWADVFKVEDDPARKKTIETFTEATKTYRAAMKAWKDAFPEKAAERKARASVKTRQGGKKGKKRSAESDETDSVDAVLDKSKSELIRMTVLLMSNDDKQSYHARRDRFRKLIKICGSDVSEEEVNQALTDVNNEATEASE